MNNSGLLPQEKMELDLEIPSSLVQSDGHLRRSNSAPMINGLRFYDITFFFQLICPFSVPCINNILSPWAEGAWHMDGLWICRSSDNSQVFQREVLRSRRNSTTVVNRPNMVQYFIKNVWKPNCCLNYWVLDVFLSTCILLCRSPHRQFGSPAPDFIRLSK